MTHRFHCGTATFGCGIASVSLANRRDSELAITTRKCQSNAKKYRVASAQEILQQVIRQQTILTLIGKMKIRLLVSIIGVVITFALTTLAQQKGAPDPELRQMIDAFAKKYAEAVNNNDAAAIAAFYTEDGVLVTSEGPKYGREAIERFYEDLFRQFHFSNYSSKADQYSPHLIGTTGNQTLEIGEWRCTSRATAVLLYS